MTRQSARAEMNDELQQELRDLLCLAVAGDHTRWVLSGEGTAELTEWLREAIAEWRAWADLVAGLLVARGVAPGGRVRSLAKDLPRNWVPPGWLSPDETRKLMAGRLTKVCEWARYRRSQAAEASTRRLLDTVCAGMEAQLARLAALTA
ncbi:MAG: ferritin-like domain-containing protein [Streptosporangiaceae bacterium]